jgi:hypothetical protein
LFKKLTSESHGYLPKLILKAHSKTDNCVIIFVALFPIAKKWGKAQISISRAAGKQHITHKEKLNNI